MKGYYMVLHEKNSGLSECANCFWETATGLDGLPGGAANGITPSEAVPGTVYIGDRDALVKPSRGNICVDGRLSPITPQASQAIVAAIVEQQPRAIGGPENFHFGPVDLSGNQSSLVAGDVSVACVVSNLFGPRPQ